MSVTATQSQVLTLKPVKSVGVHVAQGAAIGGVVGAAAGALAGALGIPFIGALGAPITAAIGGAAGIIVGGLIGFFRGRAAQDGAAIGAGTINPATPPTPPSTATGLPPALPR